MLRPSIMAMSPARSISASAGADQLAVAQHRDGIADLKYLAEAVGDVDDRLALRLQRTQRGENAFDLDVGQRRGRLVEDQHARIAREHARDLDQLTLADAELRHRRLQSETAQTHLFQRLPRPLTQSAAAMKQRHLAVAEPDIVEHR